MADSFQIIAVMALFGDVERVEIEKHTHKDSDITQNIAKAGQIAKVKDGDDDVGNSSSDVEYGVGKR